MLFSKKLNKELNIKGVALLEFAIVAPIFFGFMFNMVYAGLALHDRHVLSEIVYEKVRSMSADANENISLIPDADGGSGLALGDATKDIEDVYKKVNDQLFLYKLDKNGSNISGIQISIKPHEGIKSKTEETSSYIKVTINDADIMMKVQTKLKDNAVPELASLLCPKELEISKEMRLELHINKTLTVLGQETSSNSTANGIGSSSGDITGDSGLLGENVSIDFSKPSNYNTDFTTNIVDTNDPSNNTNRYFSPSDFDSFLFDMLSTNSYYKDMFFENILVKNNFNQLLSDLVNSGYFYNYKLDLYYNLNNAKTDWSSFLEQYLKKYYALNDDIALKIDKAELLYVANDNMSIIKQGQVNVKDPIDLKEYFIIQYTIANGDKSETYNMVLSRSEEGSINSVGANLNSATALGFNVNSVNLMTGTWSNLENDNFYVETTGANIKEVRRDEEGNNYIVVNNMCYKLNDEPVSVVSGVGNWQAVCVSKDNSDKNIYKQLGSSYYELENIDAGLPKEGANWQAVYIDTKDADNNPGAYYRYANKVDGQYVYGKIDESAPKVNDSGIWVDLYHDTKNFSEDVYAKVGTKYYKIDDVTKPTLFDSTKFKSSSSFYVLNDGTEGNYAKVGNYLYKLESLTDYTSAGVFNIVKYDASQANMGSYIKLGNTYYKLDLNNEPIVNTSANNWQTVYWDTNPGNENNGTYLSIGSSYYKTDISNGKTTIGGATGHSTFYIDTKSSTTNNMGIYLDAGGDTTNGGKAYLKLDCYDSDSNTVAAISSSELPNKKKIDVRADGVTIDSDLYYRYKNGYNIKVGTYENGQYIYDYALPAWQWDVLYNQQVK